MKIIRNYLKDSELQEIVNTLVGIESSIDREIVKIGMVAQCVCDELGEFKDCNDIYNTYIQCEDEIDFDYDIKNMYVIDKCVKEELGVDTNVRTFLNELNVKIKDINFNPQELVAQMEQLKGVINNA
ncbi:MAG: hypothetical protein KBT03_03680 [Bacteroidales bacterium]|nr:hypothetical protein [Candidatus Scybalousia scybalohippi]